MKVRTFLFLVLPSCICARLFLVQDAGKNNIQKKEAGQHTIHLTKSRKADADIDAKKSKTDPSDADIDAIKAMLDKGMSSQTKKERMQMSLSALNNQEGQAFSAEKLAAEVESDVQSVNQEIEDVKASLRPAQDIGKEGEKGSFDRKKLFAERGLPDAQEYIASVEQTFHLATKR